MFALLAVIGIVFLLLLFVPHRCRQPERARPSIDLAGRALVLDWCEVCGAECTHELSGAVDQQPDGGAGMIAMYCEAHAPAEAVRVR